MDEVVPSSYGVLMAWHWRYHALDGSPASPEASSQFPTQGDAETWIGETWRELLDGGVESVTLMEDGREVYGPMGLRPA